MGILDNLDLPNLEDLRRDRHACPKPKTATKQLAAERICQLCKKAFKKFPSIKSRFCSQRCFGLSRRRRGTCAICGKERSLSRKCCSRACAAQLMRIQTTQARPCKYCRREFLARRRSDGWSIYCSWRCKVAGRRSALIQVTCAQCARQFQRRDTRHVRRYRIHFCNIVCRAKFVKGPNHSLYRGGADPNRGHAWTKLADAIRKRDGYICQRCNRSQEANKQRLSVDHIRPWRSFSDKAEANEPSNLVSLCRRCHMEKTAKAERAWLRGDRLALLAYEKSVKLPPLFATVNQ